MLRPAMTPEDKGKMNAANLAAMDTALQLYDHSHRERLTELSLKSALLVSKVYLSDSMFCDHGGMWRLYKDSDFRSLLSHDYDSRPAVLVGLRQKKDPNDPEKTEPCNTPVEAMDEMIKSRMIFSSLFNRPDIHERIDQGKIRDSADFFDQLQGGQSTYENLTAVSRELIGRNTCRWQSDMLPGQYYEMVRALTETVCSMKDTEVDLEFQKVAKKFKPELTQDKRLSYSRGKAERDLWNLKHGRSMTSTPEWKPGDAFYDFVRLVIDFSYNFNVTVTNPTGMIWHGGEFGLEGILPRRFHTYLKEHFPSEVDLREIKLRQGMLDVLEDFIGSINFKFINELRTGERCNEFEKSVNGIQEAKDDDMRIDRISHHLERVFERFVEHPMHKNEKILWGFKHDRLSKLLRPLHGLKLRISDLLSVSGIALLLVIWFSTTSPIPIYLEPLRSLSDVASGGLTFSAPPSRLFADHLRYTGYGRFIKAMFSKHLIKEVTST